MVLFGIILLLLTPILLAAALAVRHAGDRRALNSMDYSTISDAAGLNRWAGNHLLLLPLLSLVFGVASLDRPALGIVGSGVVMLVAVFLVVRIYSGSDRFRAGR